MSRITRLLNCLSLCLIASLLLTQVGPSWADDSPAPAPAEPSEGTESQEDDQTVKAIEGTQPSSETDAKKAATDDRAATDDDETPGSSAATDNNVALQGALEDLRRELTTRIGQLETRLDEQVARIEGLQQSISAVETTTTANKPPATGDSPDEAPQPSADRDAELARVQRELDQLRADYKLLFNTISDHAAAINDHAVGLAKQTKSVSTHDEQLTATNEKLLAVQQSQQGIEAQLRDAATGANAPNVLGNMQADSNARQELFRNARYRLRIRNTSGIEQPLIVNGVQWTIRADEWTYIPIPLGPVTLQRPDAAPIEVAEDHVQWKSDKRGFYVDYDLDLNQVSVPTEG